MNSIQWIMLLIPFAMVACKTTDPIERSSTTQSAVTDSRQKFFQDQDDFKQKVIGVFYRRPNNTNLSASEQAATQQKILEDLQQPPGSSVVTKDMLTNTLQFNQAKHNSAPESLLTLDWSDCLPDPIRGQSNHAFGKAVWDDSDPEQSTALSLVCRNAVEICNRCNQNFLSHIFKGSYDDSNMENLYFVGCFIELNGEQKSPYDFMGSMLGRYFKQGESFSINLALAGQSEKAVQFDNQTCFAQ